MTAGFDPATPNMARVYDYWLDGKDNYPADRAEAQRLLGIYPPLRDLVRENRAFVFQAVSWAARQGIGQFIDLGAGLPASPAVHQAARKVMPAARVAYVNIDPVVLSHARALLATSDHHRGTVWTVKVGTRSGKRIHDRGVSELLADLAHPAVQVLTVDLIFQQSPRLARLQRVRRLPYLCHRPSLPFHHDDRAMSRYAPRKVTTETICRMPDYGVGCFGDYRTLKASPSRSGHA